MENNEQLVSCLLDSLDVAGICVTPEELALNQDINLNEYFVDSTQFLSFIIELESRIGREVPEEFLLADTMASFNGLVEAISALHLEPVKTETEVLQY